MSTSCSPLGHANAPGTAGRYLRGRTFPALCQIATPTPIHGCLIYTETRASARGADCGCGRPQLGGGEDTAGAKTPLGRGRRGGLQIGDYGLRISEDKVSRGKAKYNFGRSGSGRGARRNSRDE